MAIETVAHAERISGMDARPSTGRRRREDKVDIEAQHGERKSCLSAMLYFGVGHSPSACDWCLGHPT